MAWVTYGAGVDFLAAPDLMGGLRLGVEAIAMAVLAGGAARALAPRRDRRDRRDRRLQDPHD